MILLAEIKETAALPGYQFYKTETGVAVKIHDDGFTRIEMGRSMAHLLWWLKKDLELAI